MGKNTVTIEGAGGHQELHIGKFRADRRGLVSGSVQRHVKEEFDELNFNLLKTSAAPALLIPCVGVERDYVSPHGIYTYSYEGIASEIDDESLTTFELDITMEEVSMEAHPNLAKIEAKYGRFDPRLRRFTQKTLSSSAEEDSLSGNGATTAKRRNPLFGADSYLSFGATFKKSYVRKSIPARVLRGIGTIINRPIGLGQFPLPKAAKHRKWLKLAPKITKRGNCVHIEENFIMSGRHGIVKEVYGAAQLEEDSDDSDVAGSSLTTGSL